MKAAFGVLILALLAGQCFAVELDRMPPEAVTVDGQKVRLFPNRRWEFADAWKAQQLAAQYPGKNPTN